METSGDIIIYLFMGVVILCGLVYIVEVIVGFKRFITKYDQDLEEEK